MLPSSSRGRICVNIRRKLLEEVNSVEAGVVATEVQEMVLAPEATLRKAWGEAPGNRPKRAKALKARLNPRRTADQRLGDNALEKPTFLMEGHLGQQLRHQYMAS
jgi:hypothetical protein